MMLISSWWKCQCRMKISVLGAGAIGSMLGGLIKHHAPDMDVLLIMRGEHGEAVARRGTVGLDGPWGHFDVPVTVSQNVADIAGSDFVLLTVKSQATLEAIQSAAPSLGNATVISIQNGINDDTLLAHLPAARLVMGMTATNMAILEPGSVSLQLGGATVVGPFADGSNARAAKAAADLLRKTGLEIDEHANVLGVRYNKLAINALGYASCLSDSNFITEAVCDKPWRQNIGLPIVNECVMAFQKAGIEMAKIPGRPGVEQLRGNLRLMNQPVIGAVVAWVARRIYNKKPIVFSLGQDLRRRKTTEVDYINGAIVGLAESNGLAAPYNAKVVELVHELEDHHRHDPRSKTFFRRDEVIDRFQEIASPLARTV